VFIDVSKSFWIATAATPMPMMGNVTPAVMRVPTLVIDDPMDFILPLAEFIALLNCDVSARNLARTSTTVATGPTSSP
jgi:hypothetical protein